MGTLLHLVSECQDQWNTTAPVSPFPNPDAWIHSIHVDLVGPSKWFTYHLMLIDWLKRWTESIPLTAITAGAVSHALPSSCFCLLWHSFHNRNGWLLPICIQVVACTVNSPGIKTSSHHCLPSPVQQHGWAILSSTKATSKDQHNPSLLLDVLPFFPPWYLNSIGGGYIVFLHKAETLYGIVLGLPREVFTAFHIPYLFHPLDNAPQLNAHMQLTHLPPPWPAQRNSYVIAVF